MPIGSDRPRAATATGAAAATGAATTTGAERGVGSRARAGSGSGADAAASVGSTERAAATAFTELFHAHRTALYGYLLGRTGRPGTAEELTQDLFLRAWRHLPELTGRSAEGQRAWLFTVARNLAVDELRQRRTRDATLSAVRAQPTGHAPAASTAVVAADEVQRVGAAIAGLPEELRTVLSLATAGELTSAEIAALLGIPAGTVRYRLSRARAALAAVLTDGTATPPHRPRAARAHRKDRQ